MIDYTKILLSKYPGTEWTLDGEEYKGLTWLSDTPKPTKTTLDDLWDEVQTEIITKAEIKAQAKSAILDRLGITADEVKLLLS